MTFPRQHGWYVVGLRGWLTLKTTSKYYLYLSTLREKQLPVAENTHYWQSGSKDNCQADSSVLTSQGMLLERDSTRGCAPYRQRGRYSQQPQLLALPPLWVVDLLLGKWPHSEYCWESKPHYTQKPVEEPYSPRVGPLTVILTLRIWRHWMGSVSTHVMSRITSAITRAATNPSSCRSLIICKRIKVTIFLCLLALLHRG